MSAALPPTDKHASAVGNMSKGRVVKGIEQTGCGDSKSAQGDGKFAATVATPLQYASAGDSPPTTLLCFSSNNTFLYIFPQTIMNSLKLLRLVLCQQ